MFGIRRVTTQAPGTIFNYEKSFLAYVAAHGVAMLVLDIWKEMTGPELQEQLRANSPDTRAIVMTRRVHPDDYEQEFEWRRRHNFC